MDMEKLNNSQLVLLTLFVSFMTSTATGIVTVALMQQAPLAITETVNRVVERTVEKVVPGQPVVAAAATPVTQTIVIKDSESVVKAVENIAPSIVRVYTQDASSSVFIALGIVMDANGTIATDASQLGTAKDIDIEMPGGRRTVGSVIAKNSATGIGYVAAATTTVEAKPILWKPAQLSAQHPTIGQAVVAISGKSASRIGNGIITALSATADNVGSPEIVETNVSKDSLLPGSPIIDAAGNVLGMNTRVSRLVSEAGFIASAYLNPAPAEVETKDANTH